MDLLGELFNIGIAAVATSLSNILKDAAVEMHKSDPTQPLCFMRAFMDDYARQNVPLTLAVPA